MVLSIDPGCPNMAWCLYDCDARAIVAWEKEDIRTYLTDARAAFQPKDMVHAVRNWILAHGSEIARASCVQVERQMKTLRVVVMQTCFEAFLYGAVVCLAPQTWRSKLGLRSANAVLGGRTRTHQRAGDRLEHDTNKQENLEFLRTQTPFGAALEERAQALGTLHKQDDLCDALLMCLYYEKMRQ